MSVEEFDSTVADLMNFMYYRVEPVRSRRQEIGVWVLAFLGVLLCIDRRIG
jgi:cytochrome c1